MNKYINVEDFMCELDGSESMAEARRRLETGEDVYEYCPHCGAMMDKKEGEKENA